MAVAIPAIALALTAIGTATAVAGAVAQGQAASNAAKYNKQVADINAKASMDQANYEANQQDVRLKSILATQRAIGAANGSGLGGSFTDTQESTQIQGKLDELATKYKGQYQATNYQNQGTLAGIQGQNAVTNSMFQAGGAAISGAAQGTNQYMAQQGYGAQPSYNSMPTLDGYMD